MNARAVAEKPVVSKRIPVEQRANLQGGRQRCLIPCRSADIQPIIPIRNSFSKRQHDTIGHRIIGHPFGQRCLLVRWIQRTLSVDQAVEPRIGSVRDIQQLIVEIDDDLVARLGQRSGTRDADLALIQTAANGRQQGHLLSGELALKGDFQRRRHDHIARLNHRVRQGLERQLHICRRRGQRQIGGRFAFKLQLVSTRGRAAQERDLLRVATDRLRNHGNDLRPAVNSKRMQQVDAIVESLARTVS